MRRVLVLSRSRMLELQIMRVQLLRCKEVRMMIDVCILALILSGVALLMNIAVCLYTLHLAKQAEHSQKMEGYVEGLLHSQISPADKEQQR